MKDKPISYQIWVIISTLCSLVAIGAIVLFLVVLKTEGFISISDDKLQLVAIFFEIILCVIAINMIIAKAIAIKIIRPLKLIEQKMNQISVMQCEGELISVDRQDEIGNLTNSLVDMQKNLKKMQEEEGFFLQSVSHGLKTPIMVIKNCCQALKDGIYIHNSKEYTISVIEEEADTLEDTIKKFLIINSFDYMLGKKSDFVEIKIRRMLRDIVDRVSAGNKDLDILLSGEEYSVWGTMDLLKSAINNLMENAIRYANTYIHIEILPDESNPEKYILVAIKNDGDEIEESTIAGFFQKYHKGRKGNFGLGLYITKRIMEFHDGEVWAENKTKEVKFVMKMKRYEKI